MDHDIIDLMHECVVKLDAPTPGRVGTGFFVAPGLILTCAHVVGNHDTKKHCNGNIKVGWKKHKEFAVARVKEWEPDLDIALLIYPTVHAEKPPCVLLGKVCRNGHKLVTFGYPKGFSNGDPADFSCTGYTGDLPPFIRFKDDRVRGGMSGSPVLNLETKRVCGMVKFTVDTRTQAGGGGIWADTIFQHFKELKPLQKQHHQQDPRWLDIIGAKTPGVLLKLVLKKIVKKLEDPGMQILKNSLSHVFKAKRGVIVPSAAMIALKLVEIEKKDTLLLLLLAYKNTVTQLEKKRVGDAAVKYTHSGVFDILGWVVLLAVNTTWLSKNRNEMYPEEFTGSIDLPVKTESGIEIIHASIHKRRACFDLAGGIPYGAYRIPTVDHHLLLETGISTTDTVNEIKRSIHIYLNKYWGKEKVPDHFGADENEDLNAQLESFNFTDEGRYLVVQGRKEVCPLNDEVYKVLTSDLPALQVVFKNCAEKGEAFKVSEVTLNSRIRDFLLTK